MIHLIIAVARAAIAHPVTIQLVRWCGTLAARMLASSLNLPEPLVRNTGTFAIAYIEAVERRATWVCPMKLWHDLKQQQPSARSDRRPS